MESKVKGLNLNSEQYYAKKAGAVIVTEPKLFKCKDTGLTDTFETSAGNVAEDNKNGDGKKFPKWLAIGGAVAAFLALAVMKGKKLALTSSFSEICQEFADFNNFKNLKMCKNLSNNEKVKVLKSLQYDLNAFLPTLNGNKPMAFLVDFASDSPVKMLNKLDLGDNFEFIDRGSFGFAHNTKIWDTFFINKSKTLDVIERNMDFYTTRLSLPKTSTKEEVYQALTDMMRKTKSENFPDDLLGMTLGFPRYDTMIYQLEKLGNISIGFRDLPEYPEMILKVLNSDKSPYKELSEETLNGLKDAIMNINKNGKKDCYKGGITRRYYQFVNYTNDPIEYQRISNDVKDFEETFKISNLV